jgi:hypothetical protein
MKTYLLTTSSALLAAAAIMLVGCGEVGGGDTGSLGVEQRQTTDGTCNATAARTLRTAQACFRSGCEPGTPECNLALSVLNELFSDPYCGPAMLSDELNGLPTGNPVDQPAGPNEGDLKHIGIVFCSAISDCGACPALPEGFCPGIC